MPANPEVDDYVARSKKWPKEISKLRPILRGRGLVEEMKWGKPCYSHEGRNIVIVQEMNDFLALMFFKGALLKDPKGVLEAQGPNSRSARRITFTSTGDLARLTEAVKSFVDQAIRVENAGLTVGPPPKLELVEELRRRLNHDRKLAAAFSALTPGRRREYNLYVSGAKQSSTRESRIDKCATRILAGKGLRDP